MLLDPTITLTLRGAFALMFAAASTHKLLNVAQFRQTLLSYLRGFGIDAHGREKPLLATLIVLEIGVVAACALPAAQAAAGLFAGGMLLLYAFAMTVNLIRGNILLDCGCTWRSTRQRVRPALIIRNVLLSVIAFALMAPVASRDLAAIDTASILGATLTVILLYSAANRLLALTVHKRSNTS
jgi:hypothetical protein